ncbi:MAG: hypothetical protein U5L96_05835 [Owenweeksia sp.]|nr:hypothetical protein [Owenweeksia sp.]
MARLINEGFAAANIIFVDYVPHQGQGQLSDIMQVKARLTPIAMNQSIQTVSLVEDEEGQMEMDALKDAIVDSSQNVMVVLSDDKVFLSRVVGALRSAGTDVTRVSTIAPQRLWTSLRWISIT